MQLTFILFIRFCWLRASWVSSLERGKLLQVLLFPPIIQLFHYILQKKIKISIFIFIFCFYFLFNPIKHIFITIFYFQENKNRKQTPPSTTIIFLSLITLYNLLYLYIFLYITFFILIWCRIASKVSWESFLFYAISSNCI